jgi:shikimate dehydrogenase
MGVPYAEVIGDPVAHSKSPLIHKFWLEKLGLAGDYRAVRVAADELADYLAARRADPGWRGCNVTMPHKAEILPLLDTTTRDAKRIGAVNTVRNADGRLYGRNTDLHGIYRSLDHVIEPGMRVVLIGAGGAARAAACAVKRHAPREVTVINRSVDRGRKLLRDFHLAGRVMAETAIPPADLVINAAPPYANFALDALAPHAVVFDMVYHPRDGALLAQARRGGFRMVDGLTMLIHQAAEAFAVFFKRARPPDSDGELRELLIR